MNAEFNFQIDLAASAENTKCRAYFTNDPDAPIGMRDSLAQDWSVHDCGWLNPPYSRGLCAKFIAKAAAERLKGFLTVMLLPARTDTKAFHAHIYDAKTWQCREGVEVRFLPGRIKFVGAKHGAPFPSMIVIFRGARN